MILLRHEWRSARTAMLVWAVSIGLLCFITISLFTSMENSAQSMAESLGSMGGLSASMGMDKMNIADFNGYYAVENALIFSVGSAMFAAYLGIISLAKEEEGHTAEFLYTLPYNRRTVWLAKYLSIVCLLLAFNCLVIFFEVAAVKLADVDLDFKAYWLYHIRAFLMQNEVAAFCLLLSAFYRKKQVGLALGLALLLYALDMLCRLIEDVAFLKYVTPYYYANAITVFSQEKLNSLYLLIAGCITVCSLAASYIILKRRDLSV
ncbi:ABC transporter permease subunit [Streptococcus sp. H49]|uniref:ABC transporter permease subunit n=1 Tax=Streptococcus huangxiaojuni TaxID=3237239 RepID=UPI0034A5446D